VAADDGRSERARVELAAVRMQHAAALLQGTDLPVSEVAHRVGYRQAAQFAKAFRRHHGTSPNALRRTPGGRHTSPAMATVYLTEPEPAFTETVTDKPVWLTCRECSGPTCSPHR
jgi:hypothetical protein